METLRLHLNDEYEFALARIEELLPMVDDNTPANDRNAVELTIMSDVVIDYEKEHCPSALCHFRNKSSRYAGILNNRANTWGQALGFAASLVEERCAFKFIVMNKRIKRLLVILMTACIPGMSGAQRPEIPSNVVKLDAGVSFIASKVYVYNLGDNSIHQYTWKPGFSVKMDYEHFRKSGWGFGVNVMYHNTNFDAGYGAIGYVEGYYEYQFTQWYFGPCAAYRFRFGDSKWMGDVSVGMGYAQFSEGLDGGITEHYGGLGVSWRAGMEYMLSPNIGLGVDLTSLMTFVSQPDYSNTLKALGKDESDGVNGFYRLGLMAGLRFYF